MGWPNVEGAVRRYDVMLDVIRKQSGPVRLLDFGCGTGHLYEHICHQPNRQIDYHGIDLSSTFIDRACRKHPGAKFAHGDVLKHPEILETYDYAIINGVFTSKCDMSHEVMLEFAKRIIKLLFQHVRIGVAFNATSKQVDWERDDLFHLPLDTVANFLCTEVSRNFVIRNDYGLYEFATYVYHDG